MITFGYLIIANIAIPAGIVLAYEIKNLIEECKNG